MVKKIMISFLAGAIFMLVASSTYALGIGAYIEAAGGESYRKVKSRSLEDTGGKLSGYGFRAGLIFDTCVACDSDFSYRLKLGGGMAKADFLSRIDYNGIYMSHTFAFAAVKNDYVKFWIGPQIGFSYRRGSSDRWFIGTETVSSLYYFGTVPTPNLWNIGTFKERTKYDIFGADGGLAFGVNLNLGDYVTVGLEAAVKYGYNTGTQDRELYNPLVPYIPYNRFKGNRLREHGIEGYGSFAFIIRFSDTYQ